MPELTTADLRGRGAPHVAAVARPPFTLVAVVLVAVVLGGTAPKAGAASSHAPNHIGKLTVVDAFLPLPPSPDVASVYLTVRNSGSHADALVSVSTHAAMGSMLMTEFPDGSMAMLRQLIIPAHGRASLTPGRDHLMLEVPIVSIQMGQRVPVTLRFAHAGSITIEVPVVPLSAILGHSGT